MSRPFRASDFPSDKARRALLGQPTAEQERSRHILESDEQKAVIKIFVAAGFKVWKTSSHKRAKISAGFPDLWVAHKTKPVAFWFETKKQVGGVLSEVQREFAEYCQRAGIRWDTGDRYDAAAIAATVEGK